MRMDIDYRKLRTLLHALKVYRGSTDKAALFLNFLKPNDIYISRTAALTSRRYILNIYSTNIHSEYFKHAA